MIVRDNDECDRLERSKKTETEDIKQEVSSSRPSSSTARRVTFRLSEKSKLFSSAYATAPAPATTYTIVHELDIAPLQYAAVDD